MAGTLGLGKLIAYYDDNGISIDGDVAGWFADNTPQRFEAYGWHVIDDVDGHDPEAIKAATEKARAESDKPTLICCKTIIGKGAPNKQGGHKVHGEPLGAEEIAATREPMRWKHGPFEMPDDIYAGWDAKAKGAEVEASWNERFAAYEASYPGEASEFKRRMSGELPDNWEEASSAAIQNIAEQKLTQASRASSKTALNAFGPLLPEFLGGSADLTPSNNTFFDGSKYINDNHGGEKDFSGNYISYGVREFGMSAIMNGITLHGGLMPYGATFLMFSEYARNALRMAALMKIRSIFVYTHDSIGLGEDGPTHQAVEQIPTLRMIPNMNVWRACDAVEWAVAWKSAIGYKNTPSCLIFSRQKLPHIVRDESVMAEINKGGYVLRDTDGIPDVIVIATGSEVHLAVEAARLSNKKVRVVSMPSSSEFNKQDEWYKEFVLPKAVTARVAVEAAIMDGWGKYVGLNGKTVGMTTFGESAPASELFRCFDITVNSVLNALNEVSFTPERK